MAEFGRCPETTLVGTCTLISEYVGWNASRIGLSNDEKMLLLFMAEAWRWRRVELVMK